MTDLGDVRLGARVRALRTARGLTGEQLASAAGISRPYLSQIESGQRGARLTTLESIALALNVSVRALFVDSGSLLTAFDWTRPERVTRGADSQWMQPPGVPVRVRVLWHDPEFMVIESQGGPADGEPPVEYRPQQAEAFLFAEVVDGTGAWRFDHGDVLDYAPGDVLRYDARQPVTFRMDSPTRLLMLSLFRVTPPPFEGEPVS